MRHDIDTLPASTLLEPLSLCGEYIGHSGPIDELTFNHLGMDSREVGSNGLFAALRGSRADGHTFIDKAVQNGATAIVCESLPEAPLGASGTAFIRVRNARRALAHIAAHIYGYPSRELTMVGITGTNGKTTTAWLVAHILNGLGTRTGLLSTIHYRLDEQVIGSGLTTPDSPLLHRSLRRMLDLDCKAVVMEVSSHALDQHRVDAVTFDAAVFTNLTRDHLDYHGSFEDYLEAKKKLFDLLPYGAHAIYNAQDAAGSRLVADTKATKCGYGPGPSADFQLQILENRLDGLLLKIDGLRLHSSLVGTFNAENVAAAYATACKLGYEPGRVASRLEDRLSIPGRFERIPCRPGVTAIVDYAHTPDALASVLASIRETAGEKATIWCVFGCGGDRDHGKRRDMGAIAADLADRVIITSDNPRHEDPETIIREIEAGLPQRIHARTIPDRRTAIQLACSQAVSGDIVLVAGKGHETVQIIGDDRLPFDDREEVRRACGHFETKSESGG